MPREINLISAISYQNKKNIPLPVPDPIAHMMKSSNVVAYYLESKDQINILGLDDEQYGYDPGKCKIFNVLIHLSKDDMQVVMQLIRETFSSAKVGQFKVLMSTGVCDIKTASYVGCIWQGLIVSPGTYTKASLEDAIMKANLKLGLKTFKGVDAEEVVVIKT